MRSARLFYLFIFLVIIAALPCKSQVDISASYPGGQEEYNQFIADNLEYPESAVPSQASATIKVLVDIDTFGKLTIDTFFTAYSGLGFEEEVTSLITAMPNWNPAVHNGKLASTQIVLKYKFDYNDDEEGEEVRIKYYKDCEVFPTYPGGNSAAQNFVKTYLKDSLLMNVSSARIKASFIVMTDGTITNVTILENDNSIADSYWIYCLKKLPKWRPGTINNKKINVYRELTIDI
jgi:hypothetical protein